MAISLATAEAAVNALRGLDRQKLFASMSQAGPHLFAKHMSKDAAHNAAVKEHAGQGYFKKIGTAAVASIADFRTLDDRERRHIVGLPQGKIQAKSFGRNR